MFFNILCPVYSSLSVHFVDWWNVYSFGDHIILSAYATSASLIFLFLKYIKPFSASGPLHMLCLDAFPFFALLGTHILPSRLSLGITSLKHSCSWLLCIPLTWQVDVLSSGSGSVIAATTLLGSCSLSLQNYDLQDRGFYLFIFLRPAFSTMSGK